MTPKTATGVCILVCAVSVPAVSAGAATAPHGNSGIEQYLEPVPGAEGDRPTRLRDTGRRVDRRTERRLAQAGAAGQAVVQLVEKTGTAPPTSSQPQRASAVRGAPPALGRPTAARSKAVDEGPVGLGWPLPVAIVLSTAAILGVALRRRRAG